MNKFTLCIRLIFPIAILFAYSTLFVTPVVAQNTLLYGMTWLGGANHAVNSGAGGGTLFSFDVTRDTEQVLWSFGQGTDGSGPTYGKPAFDASNGLFYMVTYMGGSNGKGALVSFDPTSNKDSVLWSFGAPGDGAYPVRSIVLDTANGLFYGTTIGGGDNNMGGGGNGTIFSFDPATNTEKVLWSFGGTNDGIAPYSDPVFDVNNRTFYGTTEGGGANTNCPGGCGIIFSFNIDSNVEHVVRNFGSNNDGAYPYGNLIYNANNTLMYGMTSGSGNNPSCYNNCGTIYSFDPATNNEQVVWNFGSGTDGAVPWSNLVCRPNDSLFYGLTLEGGSHQVGNGYGAGVIFSFNPTTNQESVLWDFAGGPTDGAAPRGDMVYDAGKGLFYGLTTGGGSNAATYGSLGAGTIFSFDPVSHAEHVVWSFGNGSDGQYPASSLVLITGPVADFVASDTSVCPGAAVNFHNLSAGASSWQWYFPGATPDTSTALNPSGITYSTTGRYNVQLIAGNGMQQDTLLMSNYINVNPTPLQPVLSATGPAICYYDSSLIQASGPYSSYLWNNNDTGSYIYVDSNGDYRVTVTDANGCTAVSGAKHITVFPVTPIPVLSANDSVICASDSARIDVTIAYSAYRWSNEDAASYIYANNAGNYWVTVTDANGCTAVSAHQYISVYPVTSLAITVQGDTLSSFNARLYQWYLGNSLLQGDTDAVYIARQTGDYEVQIVDTNGCSVTSSPVHVVVNGVLNLSGDNLFRLYPNPADEFITVKLNSEFPAGVLKIYDLLGQLIISMNMAQEQTIPVKELAPGIYYLSVQSERSIQSAEFSVLRNGR